MEEMVTQDIELLSVKVGRTVLESQSGFCFSLFFILEDFENDDQFNPHLLLFYDDD